MIDPRPRQASGPVTTAGYHERLRTPWWWYPLGILAAVLLGAEFTFVVPDSIVWLPLVLSVLVAIGVVWRLSASVVAVRDGQVIAGDRTLDVADIEQTYRLSYAEVRRAVGRHGDPLAFTFVRSWVGPGVQLVLTPRPTAPDAASDAGDTDEPAQPQRLPEPYWLISTRHPDRLLAAIEAARASLHR